MKCLAKTMAILVFLIGGCTCAMADTEITWTLNNVHFSDGDQITGWIETNTSVTSVIAYSIDITGPVSFSVGEIAYLPSDIGLAPPGWAEYVDLYLASAMTSAGGTISITGGYDCPGCGTLITADNPTVTGVLPEPAVILLLGIGLGSLGIGLRRKLRAAS
jgi:hypothetical protein